METLTHYTQDRKAALNLSGRFSDNQNRAELRQTLTEVLENLTKNKLRIKIPKNAGMLQKLPNMHYHFKPEVFFQMEGITHFKFPEGKIEVHPGELCIIPSGLPHMEHVESDRCGNFRNLVVGYYSNTVSMHFAFEKDDGRPEIEKIEFFDAPDLENFVSLCDNLTKVYHTDSPAKSYVISGVLTALLGWYINLVEQGANAINQDVGKVFKTKWIVREEISNPKLNVKSIADRLQCSADYLSHLFHQETGEKLVHYIQRMRVKGAIYALETTSLYVSEIAWATGYTDAAYFAKVFKKFMGMTPNDYRQSLDRNHQREESIPKTVYFDREDFSHGTPANTETTTQASA